MTYNPNIPMANDDLSDSQPQLFNNFSIADTSFGVDHYKFSNLSGNTGKHNQITTPIFVDNPPTGLPPVTAANEPKAYAFQDSANVGVLQYSRGPSNAVPSPITLLQSTSAAIVLLNTGTTNVLDFTGLARAFCMLYLSEMSINPSINNNVYFVIWTGSALVLQRLSSGASGLTAQASGNILQIRNGSGVTLSNIYWTLEPLRLS